MLTKRQKWRPRGFRNLNAKVTEVVTNYGHNTLLLYAPFSATIVSFPSIKRSNTGFVRLLKLFRLDHGSLLGHQRL